MTLKKMRYGMKIEMVKPYALRRQVAAIELPFYAGYENHVGFPIPCDLSYTS